MTNGSSPSQGEGRREKKRKGHKSSASHRSDKKVKCKHCGNIILKSERESHQLTAHRGLPLWYKYICPNCCRTFTADEQENHLAKSDTTFKCKAVCRHCDEEFENLESHQKEKFLDQSITCLNCGSRYEYSCAYEKHVRNFPCEKRSLSCEYCGKTFNTVEFVNKHEEKVLEYDPKQKCTECKKEFKYSCDYDRHRKRKPFLCEFCKKGYCAEELLENHVQRQLESKKCPLCKKKFQHRCAAKYHVRFKECLPDLVPDEVPISCWYGCGARFSSKELLLIHETGHEILKTCSTCGRQVDRHYNRKHKKYCKQATKNVALATETAPKHSNIPPSSTIDQPSPAQLQFECKIYGCPDVFYSENELTKHLRYFHYICSDCNMIFRNELVLQRHLELAHSSAEEETIITHTVTPAPTYTSSSAGSSIQLSDLHQQQSMQIRDVSFSQTTATHSHRTPTVTRTLPIPTATPTLPISRIPLIFLIPTATPTLPIPRTRPILPISTAPSILPIRRTRPILPIPTATPILPIRRTRPILPIPTATPILPIRRTRQILPIPTATPILPIPTATPTLPIPAFTPILPIRRTRRILPIPTATPTLPIRRTPPTLPSPTATPTLPIPTATPTLPIPAFTPILPIPTATPTLPIPTATPTLPIRRTPPTLPIPTTPPTLPIPTTPPTLPIPRTTATHLFPRTAVTHFTTAPTATVMPPGGSLTPTATSVGDIPKDADDGKKRKRSEDDQPEPSRRLFREAFMNLTELFVCPICGTAVLGDLNEICSHLKTHNIQENTDVMYKHIEKARLKGQQTGKQGGEVIRYFKDSRYECGFEVHDFSKEKTSFCEEKFWTQAELKEHVKTVHGVNEAFGCQICTERFVTFNGLIGHYRDGHGIETGPKQKPYKCKNCGTFFEEQVLLNSHKNECHKCKRCGVIVKSKEELNKHIQDYHKKSKAEFPRSTDEGGSEKHSGSPPASPGSESTSGRESMSGNESTSGRESMSGSESTSGRKGGEKRQRSQDEQSAATTPEGGKSFICPEQECNHRCENLNELRMHLLSEKHNIDPGSDEMNDKIEQARQNAEDASKAQPEEEEKF